MMSNRTVAVLASLGLAATQAAAQPQAPPPLPRPDAPFVMQPMSGLHQSTIQPQLGNGMVADPLRWRATFSGTFEAAGKKLGCTSTLIAARALLTAAHCVAQDGRATIALDGVTYSGTCSMPQPGYPQVQSADWAICLIDHPVGGIKYERISIDPAWITRNRKLLLTGFGCTAIGGVADGNFRTGPAFIEWLPGELGGQPYWLATYAAAQRSDAFICEGDSGGAVYVEQPSIGRRLAVAVNSHRDLAGAGVSFLSVLSAAPARDFLDRWAADNGQRLCGMHPDAQNCR